MKDQRFKLLQALEYAQALASEELSNRETLSLTASFRVDYDPALFEEGTEEIRKIEESIRAQIATLNEGLYPEHYV